MTSGATIIRLCGTEPSVPLEEPYVPPRGAVPYEPEGVG
jgi:hypothetical protein